MSEFISMGKGFWILASLITLLFLFYQLIIYIKAKIPDIILFFKGMWFLFVTFCVFILNIVLIPILFLFGGVSAFNRNKRIKKLKDVAEEAELAELVRLRTQEKYKSQNRIDE